MKKSCIDEDTINNMYEITRFFDNQEWDMIWDGMILTYQIYYNIDYECEIEKNLHDLSCFCFDHDCSGEVLLKNEMASVFQVVGSLNAMAALYYEEEPALDAFDAWFDRYNELGLNVGKLMRYTMAFNPKEIDSEFCGWTSNYKSYTAWINFRLTKQFY